MSARHHRRVVARAAARAFSLVLLASLASLVSGCGEWDPYRYPANRGLRWTGDARAAAGSSGAIMGGPAVRFRVAGELRQPTPEGDEAWTDALVGSWGGLELTFGLLAGDVTTHHAGAVVTAGARPWISRRQTGWFLEPEKMSLLGVLVPETGVAYTIGASARLQLAWEVPIGGDEFQIVPGFVWLSPTHDPRFLGTLALRVPM